MLSALLGGALALASFVLPQPAQAQTQLLTKPRAPGQAPMQAPTLEAAQIRPPGQPVAASSVRAAAAQDPARSSSPDDPEAAPFETNPTARPRVGRYEPVVPPAAASAPVRPVPGEAAAGSASTGGWKLQQRGGVRTRFDHQTFPTRGPAAAANALAPGSVPVPRERAAVSADWQLQARRGELGALAAFSATGQRNTRLGAPSASSLRGVARELALTWETEQWGFTAGRKVLGWDVGHAFRPNDLVQREARGTVVPDPLVGINLLAAERFGADSAYTLVLANPHQAGRSWARAPGRDEFALAGRAYWRRGDADLYAFGRYGQHTRASVGSAFVWVASPSVEVHGSWRWHRRAAGWDVGAGADGALLDTPQLQALRGRAQQWLLGASWTGSQRQSVLVEWWYDGSAPLPGAWRQWMGRNAALQAQAGAQPDLALAVAGNLAWQVAPLVGYGGADSLLQRHNLLLRLSWQEGPWIAYADTLWQPADRGWAFTTGLRWQGDATAVELAWRRLGGRSDSLLAQQPIRSLTTLATETQF